MRNLTVLVVVAVAIVLNLLAVVKNEQFIYFIHHFPILDNLLIDDQYFLQEIDNISRVKCSRACARKVQCVSYFYNKSVRKCRLHANGFYNVQEGTFSSNWIYHVLGEDWCPVHDGFIHERQYNMCIHLSTDKVNDYYEATSYCASKNASIITFKTATKISNSTSIMNKINSTILQLNQNGIFQGYIGLGYSSGLWMWNDGTPLSPETNWAPQQPSRNESILCASASIKPFDTDWNWKDIKCIRSLPVFCEID
ncbi:hypothetical protein ACF0H5_017409 [Mactra antiquata]